MIQISRDLSSFYMRTNICGKNFLMFRVDFESSKSFVHFGNENVYLCFSLDGFSFLLE